MQIDKVIEAYDRKAVDYEAIVERYWHIDREPLIASLQLSPVISDAASQLGFPTGKIKWNALMDYDQLIYNSKLPIEVLLDERTERPNPFSCGCQLLLKNSKG